MHDLDVKLHEAENFSNQWKPVHIDVVQDQSDNMKVMYIRNIAICGVDLPVEDPNNADHRIVVNIQR